MTLPAWASPFSIASVAWIAAVSVWLVGGAAHAEVLRVPERPATAPTEVAPGVYAVLGEPGEVDPANRGRIGNAGFIVGDLGVLAIDTGTSYLQGIALLASIRRVTDKPVRLALITHARQEFLFGATAYQEQGIPIHMQRQAENLMRSRCEHCLATLEQVLGPEEMRDTALVKPDHEFEQSHEVDGIGRPIRILYYGHSSGPGAVAVLDERSGVLFAGGLLDQQRIPDVQDSDLDGWILALQALRKLPLVAVVPGHGPIGSPQLIDSNERYLTELRSRVVELLKAGAALSDVPKEAALPEFALWGQYGTIHRRNASVLFLRYEREQFLAEDKPKH